jgi:hypothetical protein
MTSKLLLGPSYNGVERRVVAGAATAATVEKTTNTATQKAVGESFI